MKNDNQGFYQGSFVRILGFRVEKLVVLVRFFILWMILMLVVVWDLLGPYLGKMWPKFLKFPTMAKIDLLFKWQSFVTSIVSNPKIKTLT